MTDLFFGCTRCGACCRSSIPLGLAEALDHDDRFLLALVVSAETWNLGDFGKNSPAVPITHDELLTTLAFRKDKLAMDASRDVVFQVGRLRSTGERMVTFLTAGACALGDFQAGAARCPALGPDNLCSRYNDRPLACRLFPLDPLYPEMLQSVPLAALAGKLPCDFSPSAPSVWSEGRLARQEDRELLEKRQEAIRRDSLFLPFYGQAAKLFAPMPSLSDILLSVKGNGRLDLPFAPALVFLVATGQASPERAELSLERQLALAGTAVDAALARRDKAERGRTTVLRNCLALMEKLRGRIGETAEGLASAAD